MLRAGRLRERVTVRRLTDTPTGKGGFTRDWQDVAGLTRLYAEVIGISGRESVIANALQGVATYRVTIRWRRPDAAPRANDQLVWHAPGGDVELNITAPPVDPTGRRHMLQILADTSTPQGA